LTQPADAQPLEQFDELVVEAGNRCQQLCRQRFEEGGGGVDTARHDHCATTVSRLPGGDGRGEPTVGNADPETADCRK
jgi:hypothetical protein